MLWSRGENNNDKRNNYCGPFLHASSSHKPCSSVVIKFTEKDHFHGNINMQNIQCECWQKKPTQNNEDTIIHPKFTMWCTLLAHDNSTFFAYCKS